MDSFFSIADLAFGVAAAFLAGAAWANLGWNLFPLICILFLCGALFRIRKRAAVWREVILLCAALFGGAIYFHYYLFLQTEKMIIPFGRKVVFQAIVSEEAQPSEMSDILTAAPIDPSSHTVELFVAKNSGFRYGDLLRVEGVLNAPDRAGDNPVVFSPKINLRAHNRGSWIKAKLLSLKEAILAHFNEVLPEEQAALLGGIAFGSKASFSVDLKNAMARSGTTHLVAISGYNITIVIIAVDRIFGKMLSRRNTFYLILIFLALFVLMTGVQASAVRAAIMGFIALLARESGRMFNIRNAVILTAAAMTLLDPTILMQNVGFELSFLSLLGLVYVEPAVRRALHVKNPGFLDWKENAMTTFSAQLGVLPVVVHAFGQFSATAIGANILVLGTVPFTMFLGFLLAALGFVSYFMSFFVAGCASLLLGYQLAVIRIFGTWAALPLPITFSSAFAIGCYYAALATFVFIYGKDTT